MDKKRVCVVGATGSVGQEFIQSLNNHPWFELTQIAASPKKRRKKLSRCNKFGFRIYDKKF